MLRDRPHLPLARGRKDQGAPRAVSQDMVPLIRRLACHRVFFTKPLSVGDIGLVALLPLLHLPIKATFGPTGRM